MGRGPSLEGTALVKVESHVRCHWYCSSVQGRAHDLVWRGRRVCIVRGDNFIRFIVDPLPSLQAAAAAQNAI